MWFYDTIKREDFEKRKDYVEQIICKSGGKKVDIELPYEPKTISYSDDHSEIYDQVRPVFEFKNEYFRVDEVLFKDKPFIVLEYGTLEKLMNNTMEDADPFPFDLNDDDIVKEVRYALGIEPYPAQ